MHLEQMQVEFAIAADLSSAIDFAEELPETATPEQLGKLAIPLIRYMLQAGENGYKDGIDGITDDRGQPPSAANNWLYDVATQTFQGQFVDQRPGRDRVFEFVMTLEGETWTRSFRPRSGVADD